MKRHRHGMLMWGRLLTCGRVVLGLGGLVQMVGRRVANPPQVANLPHISLGVLLALAVCPAFAQPGQPAPAQPSYSMQDSNLKPALPGALQGVGIDQKLDHQVPLDVTFHDEAGRAVPLSTFFQRRSR